MTSIDDLKIEVSYKEILNIINSLTDEVVRYEYIIKNSSAKDTHTIKLAIMEMDRTREKLRNLLDFNFFTCSLRIDSTARDQKE
ncbi:MAG: hypothetical protein WCR67_05860 [Bacilli bacterium]